MPFPYKHTKQTDRTVWPKTVHVDVCQKALGKPLPIGAQVHHVNEDKSDDSNQNLVICQNDAYHKLLHVRTRILKAGGNPNTDKVCPKCKQAKFKATEFFRRGTYCKACDSDIRRRAYVPVPRGERPRRPLGDGTVVFAGNERTQREDKVLEMLRSGTTSVPEVMARLGCSEAAACRALNQLSLVWPLSRTPPSKKTAAIWSLSLDCQEGHEPR